MLCAIKNGVFWFIGGLLYQSTFWPMYLRNMARDKMRPFLLKIPPWITPNFFTTTRIIMVIPICLLLLQKSFWTASILYLIACATDFFDGALAEVRNKRTVFGKLYDPAADKILHIAIFSIFILIFFQDWKNFQLALGTNIVIDIIIAAVAWAKFLSFKKKVFSGSNRFGKIKFGCQCSGVILVLLGCFNLAIFSFVLAAVFGVGSALRYAELI